MQGLWWVREWEGVYFPPVTLETIDQTRRTGPVDSFIRWR